MSGGDFDDGYSYPAGGISGGEMGTDVGMPEEYYPEEEEAGFSDGQPCLLGTTLGGEDLATTLVKTQAANELGLVRNEVRRLRTKIEVLEREKDDMVDNFRTTTKVLLERIKELESELSETKSRPQTAAVIERIENRSSSRPPLPRRQGTPGTVAASGGVGSMGLGGSLSRAGGSSPGGCYSHPPEVLRIEEDPLSPAEDEAGCLQVCGNCSREIPGGNFITHTVFCYKNNYRCGTCDEVIPVRDKEEHIRYWRDPERLLQAAAQRDVECLQAMAGHGVDFQSSVHPSTGDTALHEAARQGDAELIEFFMGYGVDVDPKNEVGETPLHLAARGAGVSTVKLLVELGADLNVANGNGDSPLMLASRRGAAQVAGYLVQAGADAETCTRLGDTPLQVAQRLGFTETVLALASAGAPLRPGTPSRMRSASPAPLQQQRSPTPLKTAAGKGSGATSGYPPRPRHRISEQSPHRERIR